MRANNTSLQYGMNLIYYPALDGGPPREIWFLSHQSSSVVLAFGSGVAFATNDSEVVNSYPSLQDLLNLQQRDPRKFQGLPIITLRSLSYLHPYSNRVLKNSAFH